MYRCLECDAQFEEPVRYEDDRGEFWGRHVTEKMWGCPYCHGEYEDIKDEDEEKEKEE